MRGKKRTIAVDNAASAGHPVYYVQAFGTGASTSSAIIFVLVIVLAMAQVRAGEFDSILRWRNIGPYRGGRTRAVCGVPSQPNVFYMAPGERRRF